MVARGPHSIERAIMSGEGTPVPGTQGQPAVPNLQVVGQYIKDLSFENPGAISGLTERPQIELAVDLNAARMATRTCSRWS